MAGHNKWSQIKRAKGATDAKRGKIFSKLSRDITVAAKNGGPDPDMNAPLRMVLLKAKSANMPADNIQRAIKRATDADSGAAQYQDLIYEVYAPGGVALLVEALTENRHRTAAEVRGVLKKNHGRLAESGSVTRLFHRKGQMMILRENGNEEQVMEWALDAGAEDFRADESGYEIQTEPSDFERVHQEMEAKGANFEVAHITYIPELTAPVVGEDAEAVHKLIDALEDDDDVRTVVSNAEFTQE